MRSTVIIIQARSKRDARGASALLYDDVSAEGPNRHRGAAVAERRANRVVDRAAPSIVAPIRVGIAADGHGHVGSDRSAERVRIQYKSGVSGKRQPHVARMRVQVVAAVLCER